MSLFLAELIAPARERKVVLPSIHLTANELDLLTSFVRQSAVVSPDVTGLKLIGHGIDIVGAHAQPVVARVDVLAGSMVLTIPSSVFRERMAERPDMLIDEVAERLGLEYARTTLVPDRLIEREYKVDPGLRRQQRVVSVDILPWVQSGRIGRSLMVISPAPRGGRCG